MKPSIEFLLAFAIIGLLLFMLFKKPVPPSQTIVRYDTTKTQPIVIYNMPPSQVIQPSQPAYIPINYDSLRMLFINTFKELNTVNTYDTTFKDTSYVENIRMVVTGNRLKEFHRQLTVINKNTETIKSTTARLYGGTMVYAGTQQTNLALGLTYRTRADYLFSVGKELTGRGWFTSIQIPIK